MTKIEHLQACSCVFATRLKTSVPEATKMSPQVSSKIVLLLPGHLHHRSTPALCKFGYFVITRKCVASCTLIVSGLSWYYSFCFSVCCSMRDKACKQPWKPSKATYFAIFLLSFAWQLFIKICTVCPLQLSQKNLLNDRKNCSTTTNLSFKQPFCRSNSHCVGLGFYA